MKKFRFFLFAGIFCCLAVFTGCKSDAVLPEKDAGNIVGEIKINGTTDGVYGSEIVILGTSYSASVDKAGKFTIFDVPAKSDYVLCFVDGLNKYIFPQKVEVKANETTDIGATDISFENSGNNSNGNTEGEIPVTVSATDRGIKFSAKIFNNTNNYATVTFTITEKESGIQLVRNWEKRGDWDECSMYYPFVNAGKKYTFELSADKGDWNFYKGEFTVTAADGLGEFKIENEYEPVLTEARVVKRGAKPVYTDNPKVKILKEGIEYSIYANEFNNWVFGDSLYIGDEYIDGKFNGEFDLQKIETWKNFEQIDNQLKGNEYLLNVRTLIMVAGYTDNGKTYFNMNDGSTARGEWGDEKTQVYVFFGNPDNYDDLPGTSVEFNVTTEDGKKAETLNYMVVNYGDKIFEPACRPTYKNLPDSKFEGWKYSEGDSCSFPLDATPRKNENRNITTKDGKSVDYYIMLEPKITS